VPAFSVASDRFELGQQSFAYCVLPCRPISSAGTYWPVGQMGEIETPRFCDPDHAGRLAEPWKAAMAQTLFFFRSESLVHPKRLARPAVRPNPVRHRGGRAVENFVNKALTGFLPQTFGFIKRLLPSHLYGRVSATDAPFFLPDPPAIASFDAARMMRQGRRVTPELRGGWLSGRAPSQSRDSSPDRNRFVFSPPRAFRMFFWHRSSHASAVSA
jgi:hypothetical protein